ncbi:unnamed protein product, partial [Scytosiphon promiscuus]
GGEGGDGAEADRRLLAEDRESEYQISIAELKAQIAGLEEDNRVLADAAGWELCNTSEGEEEDSLLVQTGPSQRIRVIEALSKRVRELTNLVGSASAGEKEAREAAEDACARMEDAIARAEELEAAVSHYKRGRESAENRENALREELDGRKKEHEAAAAPAAAASTAADAMSNVAQKTNVSDDDGGVDDVHAHDESDSNTGRSKSAASTDEDAAWKGRARASADTQVNASGTARRRRRMGAAGHLHGLCSPLSASPPLSPSLSSGKGGPEDDKSGPADRDLEVVGGGVAADASAV